MADLFGWLLLVLSFPLVWLSSHTRENSRWLFLSWATLGAHHLVALTNCFVFDVPGQAGDARRFHYFAVHWEVPSSMHTMSYTKFLGTVYQTLGESLLLGHELSILAYCCSLVVFIDLVVMLEHQRRMECLILCFGLLPGALFYSSLILREGFQSLFFLLALQQIVRLRLGRAPVLHAVVLVGSLAVLSGLHPALPAISALLLAFGLPWAFGSRKELLLILTIGLLGITPLIAPPLLQAGMEQDNQVTRLLNGGTDVIETYRELGNDGRTNYSVSLDLSSPGAIFLSIPAVVLAYMFMPMPWNISSPLDVYAFLEGVLRGLLLFGAFTELRGAHERRDARLFVFLAGLALECLWAFGTFNWGQALRHHVVALGPLLLGGLPPVLPQGSSEAPALTQRRARRLAQSG